MAGGFLIIISLSPYHKPGVAGKLSAELNALAPFITPRGGAGAGPGAEWGLRQEACIMTHWVHGVSSGANRVGKAEEGEGGYCGLTDDLRQQEIQGKVGRGRRFPQLSDTLRPCSQETAERLPGSVSDFGVLPEPCL